MDSKITQEILDDLIPSLKALDTRSAAILELLKHEGIASDEKLAPYLEQAASASNVRWLGVRVRIERLLSFLEKDSTEKRTVEEEEDTSETGRAKAAEAHQGYPAAQDHSNLAGLGNPNENTEEDKNTMGEDSEPESNLEANHSKRNGKNHDRLETSEGKSESAVNGAEQKVA
ncbi:MAG TPA: hypothetical protein VHQ22_00415 [Terriglobales bacterium]|jgi:hypothetical protein|nr:hypothetical protein [Terriglobales bacterium]